MDSYAAEVPSYAEVTNKDPYAYYEQLREASPQGIRWDEGLGAWLVHTHADCKVVHHDEDTFAHRYLDFPGAAEIWGGKRALLNLEGPAHAALHSFMLGYFTQRVVETYRETFARPLIQTLLARIADRDEADLDRALALPLPAYVIAAMLGVPLEDEESLDNCKVWTEATFVWVATRGEDPRLLEAALDAARNLDELLIPLIQQRRHGSGDDLISSLWREGPKVIDDWGEADMLAQARVVLNAGSHSTTHLLRNCIYMLLTRPDLRDRLKADPGLTQKFVDETMRYLGVIHFHLRSVEVDTEVAGCPVARGDRIQSVLSAANRDPEQFEDPLEFRLDRRNVQTHLGFGFGPRRCIGANLARAEAAEMVIQLLDAFPDIEFAERAPAPHMTGNMGRSYTPLHTRLTVPVAH
jgi:cytochrome P450